LKDSGETSRIEIVDLTHTYVRGRSQVAAFKKLSLSIQQGEFVSIVGPSGCGKTTLLFSIAGFIQPTSGRILVDGELISGPGPNRGVVFQSFALFNWLTVRQNVEFGLQMAGVPPKGRRPRSDELLGMVGLTRFADRYPYELSGGMKQRTAISRALATNPDILLMDEPFAALDTQSREILQEELVRIWDLTRKTVVFVTHSIDEAIYLSTRVVVFTARPGKIKYVTSINLPAPRYDPHVRTSPEFVTIKDSVLDLVREETIKQFAEEALT
jgi:NitT/TauT family transport system ATP-binding protein